MRTLEHPRWEDYEYEYSDSEGNSLYWLGDGQTYNEKTMTGDRECPLSARARWACADLCDATLAGAWYLDE